jgi:hypothetical protein
MINLHLLACRRMLRIPHVSVFIIALMIRGSGATDHQGFNALIGPGSSYLYDLFEPQ